MRIKHWQGYGCVTAKITKVQYDDVHNWKRLEIIVKGNHEWGLIKECDNYTIKRWLLDKLDKSAVDINPYHDLIYKAEWLPSEDGVERAKYTIVYGKDIMFYCS